jgi:hypothetical protein
MNKIKTNKNKVVLCLKILSILAFSLLLMPSKTFATPGYVDNPTPYIASISPNSSNVNATNIVIAITGNGFIPSSIARVNGSDRVTTFIDYSHILIKLNSNDTYNTDGFYINVFNGFPGGGYSNAEYFTINRVVPVANTDNTYSNTTQTENTTNSDSNNTDGNASNLASAAILGSTGFLPSGLIQWVLFAIIILLIVIFVRRIFGARKKYEDTPLKHA